MSNKVIAPVLYVCTNKGCDFSSREIGVDKDGKPRIIMVKTRKGAEKPALQSPPYGVVSAKVGDKAICPVCGAVCTTVEDGRHKYLRLNSQRVARLVETMRLIGNTHKGAQYEPTENDVAHVRQLIYAHVDALGDLMDKRIERIKNPSAHAPRAGQATVKLPFAL